MSATMAAWVVQDLAEKIAMALIVGTLDEHGRQAMPEIDKARCRVAAVEALTRASRVPLSFEAPSDVAAS